MMRIRSRVPGRKVALVALVAVVLVVSSPGDWAWAFRLFQSALATHPETDGGTVHIVSAPDLLNADVADLAHCPEAVNWRSGDPNTWSPEWDTTLRDALGHLGEHDAAAYLVAGDLINGRWHRGPGGATRSWFGDHTSRATKRSALHRAADCYYRSWKAAMHQHGMLMSKVYPAVGDHEVGDNPWPRGWHKTALVPDFKRAWADEFIIEPDGSRRFPNHPDGQHSDTAYATHVAEGVLLVSVDVFTLTRGQVQLEVKWKQLRWLDHVLAAARARGDVIIVQGHTPVLGPVRAQRSSRLMHTGGAASQFWQTMERHRVDLYLAGEVHDITATQHTDGGVLQVAHGGLLGSGGWNYLTIDIAPDQTISLTSYKFPATFNDPDNRLPQMGRGNVPARLRHTAAPEIAGTLTIQAGHIIHRSGVLDEYRPIS